MKQDTILIFDFGGQYCHLIARRVRENNVYSEIVPSDTALWELENLKHKFNVKGIILSGGPASIYEKNAPMYDEDILKSGIPILGLCYGHQLLARSLKGKVSAAKKQEYGISFANITKPKGILKGLAKREQVWMSHGDTVSSIPKVEVIAHTDNCPVAGFADPKRKIYGIQWHPEVFHTPNGYKIIKNFVFDICKAKQGWKVENLVNKYVSEIKDSVGDKKAIIALSGRKRFLNHRSTSIKGARQEAYSSICGPRIHERRRA